METLLKDASALETLQKDTFVLIFPPVEITLIYCLYVMVTLMKPWCDNGLIVPEKWGLGGSEGIAYRNNWLASVAPFTNMV